MSVQRSDNLSMHFKVGEFFPPGTRQATLTAGFDAASVLCREVLEPLREQFGPCIIHSGHRSRRRNARVGGAPRSFHVMPLRFFAFAAADVSFARGNPGVWAAAARATPAGGIGRYATHVHVDSRTVRTIWTG